MSTSKARKSPLYAIVLLFCAATLLPLGFLDAERQFERLLGYRPTSAVIMSGRIVEKETDEGTTYCPSLTYRYVASDKWLESDTPLPIGSLDCGDRASVESFLKKYPPKKELTAYVDPDSPTNSFLFADRSSHPYFSMLGGLAFLLFGLWLLDIRPHAHRTFQWVWSAYALAGVLVLVHDHLTGGTRPLILTTLLWVVHACIPFLTRGDPSFMADE